MTVPLSQVLGTFLVIVGVIVVARRSHYIAVVAAFPEAGLLRMVYALLELLAGLFIVIAYNLWTPLPAALITLLGWLLVIEGVAFLLMPDEAVERLVAAVNRPVVYAVTGWISILLGAYLALYGFGVLA
jgi:hypothetical protein